MKRDSSYCAWKTTHCCCLSIQTTHCCCSSIQTTRCCCSSTQTTHYCCCSSIQTTRCCCLSIQTTHCCCLSIQTTTSLAFFLSLLSHEVTDLFLLNKSRLPLWENVHRRKKGGCHKIQHCRWDSISALSHCIQFSSSHYLMLTWQ